MVTWRAVFRMAVIGIGAVGSGCTESSPRLCFSTRASFGQSLETLYCRRDSCYLMDFAAGLGGANSIGLFAAAVDRDSLAAGDELVRRFLQADIPPMKHGPTSFSVSRNDTQVSIPRHPQTDSFYVALKMWVHERKEEARARQIWRDSLILSGNLSRSREISIRLAPTKPGMSFYGDWARLRMIHTLSDSAPDSLDSQMELPATTVTTLLDGKAIQYVVPNGVDAVEAILKVSSVKDSAPLPDRCMDGVFELVSEKIPVPRVDLEVP